MNETYTLDEKSYIPHPSVSNIKKIVYKIGGPKGDCWECVSHRKDKDGYPRVTRNGGHDKPMTRYVYELYHGEIRPDMCILHSCDNRACINPAHLSQGTTQENTRQRDERGKRPQGEKNGNAKLNRLQVERIKQLRAEGLSQKRVGDLFGVSKTLVRYIEQGRIWKEEM